MQSLFEFVRRERFFFFIFLLTLVAIVLTQKAEPSPPQISKAVQKLEATAKEFDASPQSLSKWIQAVWKHPVAAVTWGGILLTLTALFIGGLAALALNAQNLISPNWFKNDAMPLKQINDGGILFFRVLVLSFAGVIILGVILGQFMHVHAEWENTITIFHSLLVDLFAVLAVFTVLRGAGVRWVIKWNFQFWWKEIKCGLMAYVFAFPLFVLTLFVVLMVCSFLHYEPPTHPLVKILLEEDHGTHVIFNFALFLAVVAAPLLEEIFFRGFCYRVLSSEGGKVFAAFTTAAFFASLHGSGFAFLPIFVLGLVLSWLYEKRGSLVACWTFHILHNILFTTYFFAIKTLIGN